VRFPVSTWKDKVLKVPCMTGGGFLTPVRGATTAGNSRKGRMFPLEWKGLVPSWHKLLESLKASTAPNHLNMTDFPMGGDAETTRAW
jgi:hypothetical protein